MPAFGRGVRTGEDKLWADAGGRPVFAITLEAIAAAGCFDLIVVAAPMARWDTIRDLAITVDNSRRSCSSKAASSRQDSVAAALDRCDGHDWISVHDAARPLTPPALFRAVLDAARAEGAATAGVPCVDTVKQVRTRPGCGHPRPHVADRDADPTGIRRRSASPRAPQRRGARACAVAMTPHWSRHSASPSRSSPATRATSRSRSHRTSSCSAHCSRSPDEPVSATASTPTGSSRDGI